MTPLDVAHLLADAADAITLNAFDGQTYGVSEKSDGSVVTDVDVTTETTIRRLLSEYAPDAGIIGEEHGTSGVDFRRWYIDPIDGTSSFVAGKPEWATMVAFEDFERLEAAVVSSPALGRRWYASRDGGAWSRTLGPLASDPEPIGVSRVDSVSAARVATWPPPWRIRPQWTGAATAFLEIADNVAGAVKGKDVKPTRGTGLPNAGLMVATGRLDGFLLCGGGPWDVAPLALIVEEAGGRFSDADGNKHYDTGIALFTNGPIHDTLLEWLG